MYVVTRGLPVIGNRHQSVVVVVRGVTVYQPTPAVADLVAFRVPSECLVRTCSRHCGSLSDKKASTMPKKICRLVVITDGQLLDITYIFFSETPLGITR